MSGRLFAFISIIGAILVVSLGLIVASVSASLLFTETRTLLDSQTQQTANAFDQYLRILDNTVMTASRQSVIHDLMTGNYSDFGSYLVYRDAYSYLKYVHASYDWINLYLVVDGRDYIMSSTPEDVTGQFRKKGVADRNWYKVLSDETGTTTFLSDFIPPVSSTEEQLAFSLKVRDLYSWKTIGYIVASIDKSVLQELLRGTNFEKDGFMLIIDERGRFVYDSNPTLSAKAFSAEQLSLLLTASASENGDLSRDYYFSSSRSATTGWRIYTFADKQAARSRIARFQLVTTLVVAAAVLILILAARLTARAYTRPIKELIDFIHTVEKNEFSEQIALESPDEVGDLVRSFNGMIASVRKNQVLRRRAEIGALEKQINPHFLFNTFESIKALALQDDRDGVVSMIERLSDMFRYTTNREGSVLTAVREEVDHVEDYLAIQKVRFGRRMTVHVRIDPAVLDCLTPRFLLQPIAENAIQHGLERRKGVFRLDIEGRIEEGDVVLRVSDNGSGIPADELERLRAWISAPTGPGREGEPGIGLKNIQERLVLSFGPRYGLLIDSVQGEGTTVGIRLPVLHAEEEAPWIDA
jgi:two-component system sensor histidine kinase YesM